MNVIWPQEIASAFEVGEYDYDMEVPDIWDESEVRDEDDSNDA